MSYILYMLPRHRWLKMGSFYHVFILEMCFVISVSHFEFINWIFNTPNFWVIFFLACLNYKSTHDWHQHCVSTAFVSFFFIKQTVDVDLFCILSEMSIAFRINMTILKSSLINLKPIILSLKILTNWSFISALQWKVNSKSLMSIHSLSFFLLTN